MPRVGFETTIPVFKLAKAVRVLDRAATVICNWITDFLEIYKYLMYCVIVLKIVF
jgi:hypothetical protein